MVFYVPSFVRSGNLNDGLALLHLIFKYFDSSVTFTQFLESYENQRLLIAAPKDSFLGVYLSYKTI